MSLTTARSLRKSPTQSERTLWRSLRLRQFQGYKFRRQHPLGHYVVDFICLEKKLIVEVDGGQHLENLKDLKRTAWLESRGFRVLRFWNDEALKEREVVAGTILRALLEDYKTPHPSLPPQGGKEKSAP